MGCATYAPTAQDDRCSHPSLQSAVHTTSMLPSCRCHAPQRADHWAGRTGLAADALPGYERCSANVNAPTALWLPSALAHSTVSRCLVPGSLTQMAAVMPLHSAFTCMQGIIPPPHGCLASLGKPVPLPPLHHPASLADEDKHPAALPRYIQPLHLSIGLALVPWHGSKVIMSSSSPSPSSASLSASSALPPLPLPSPPPTSASPSQLPPERDASPMPICCWAQAAPSHLCDGACRCSTFRMHTQWARPQTVAPA
jgi:hypothetical protein